MTNEGIGIGVEVVNALFSYDDTFVELRLGGGLPEQTLSEWADLLAGRVSITGIREGVEALTGLDAQEPVDACLTAIWGFLAWQGAVDADYVPGAQVATHPAWSTIAVELLHALRRADALWSARVLADGVLAYLSGTWQFLHQDQSTLRMIEKVSAQSAAIERALSDRFAYVAMTLHERLDEEPVRAGVVAMYFTVGEVSRAQALQARSYRPSVRQLRRLVHDSFDRMPTDPLVKELWVYFNEHVGPFDGLKYKILTGGREPTEIETAFRGIYAQALLGVAHTPPDTLWLARLSSALSLHGDRLKPVAPLLWLRVACLTRSGGLSGGGAGWSQLVLDAARLVERDSELAVDPNAYDLSPGIPTHFMDGDPVEILNTLEVYRSAALWYWRHLLPRSRADDPHVRLRSLLSGARYAESLPYAPLARKRVQVMFKAGEYPGGPVSDVTRPLLQAAASAENRAMLTAELVALADKFPALPSPRHPATVADLAAALRAQHAAV